MHPLYAAIEMANTLRDDRVAASQIKEHMSVDELIETLGLTNAELAAFLSKSEGLYEVLSAFDKDKDELVRYVVTNHRAQVEWALED